MQAGEPSITARAAAFRAAHQRLEGGRVFSDPLALRTLGPDADNPVLAAAFAPERVAIRLGVAARARFAEDAVAAAVGRGVLQVVMLGAGLDTYGCRAPQRATGLRVFEVDHPAAQEGERDRLAAAGIAVPPSPTFAPVDFERQGLADGLAAAGFDPGRPAFFGWLGVVPYLTRAAVLDTLGFIAALPGGSGVVFDYGEPPGALPPEQRAVHEARAAWAAEAARALPQPLHPRGDRLTGGRPGADCRRGHPLRRADRPVRTRRGGRLGGRERHGGRGRPSHPRRAATGTVTRQAARSTVTFAPVGSSK
ncbi:class I SAM-dependent methyltransferase [Streptomyces sp. BRA346]|uniref:class I SAM-dependent methyltransferase n=1 Tax=Streptomyces sp. BRA346 TaxID=2878199 RepID=UPI0040633BFD